MGASSISYIGKLSFVPASPFQNKRHDRDDKCNMNDKSQTIDNRSMGPVDAHVMDGNGKRNARVM